MLESIKRLLKGVTLILIIEKEKTTIIELSFYDKQHGINSDYPCINTCISDIMVKNGSLQLILLGLNS